MASDSQETNGGIKAKCVKLFRAEDEYGTKVIIGTAGASFTGMLYVDNYGSGEPRPDILDNITEDENFLILIWDGKDLFEVDWMWRPILIPKTDFVAIGSGAAAAMGAMYMGASAREAVAAAKKIDNYTGGAVKTIALK
jgi:hypothetical protein